MRTVVGTPAPPRAGALGAREAVGGVEGVSENAARGPPAPGQPPLGPFYELETSSPALSLSPGQQYTHTHRTFHLAGPEADLDRIARAMLKVGLAEMASAFRQ